MTKKKYDYDTAIAVAEKLVEEITPYVERVAVVGSLRRKKKLVKDIEVLVIAKTDPGGLFGDEPVSALEIAVKMMLDNGVMKPRLNKNGHQTMGPQNKLLVYRGLPLDLFITDAERWAVAMVVRTGSKDSNIRIAKAALDKGWFFNAYGVGFKTPDGIKKCETELDVFEMVGLKYLEPEKRNIEFAR